MDSKALCQAWRRSLEGWAIPDEILSKASSSPWRLRPESFAPSEARASSPTITKIRELLSLSSQPANKSVLDVGCGAGGISLLLLPELVSLTAVDVSQEMLDAFRQQFVELDKTGVNLRLVQGSWPEVGEQVGRAGVVICANVMYNVPDPCEFIMRLNDSAITGVVIEVHESHPHSSTVGAWKHFWNVERSCEPTGSQLVQIIESLRIKPQSLTFARDRQFAHPGNDEMVRSIRERVCLDPSMDPLIEEFLTEHPLEELRSRLIWWTKES